MGNDVTTIYSCIFVNRVWASISIPFLWQRPFLEVLNPNEGKKIIDIYLRFFTSAQNMRLQQRVGFDIVRPSSDTVFQYPSYLREVNIKIVEKAIESWLETKPIMFPCVNLILEEFGELCITTAKTLKKIYFNRNNLQPFLHGFLRREMKTGFAQTIISLHFCGSYFSTEIPILSFLEFFPNIHHLEFWFCKNLTTNQQGVRPGSSTCCQLQSLSIRGTDFHLSDLGYILENASSKLEQFENSGFNTEDTPKVLNYLELYSSNLKFLKLSFDERHFSNLNRTITVLRSLKHLTVGRQLQYLVASAPYNIGHYLKAFGAAIPKGLVELNFVGSWEFSPDELREFLELWEAKRIYISFGFCNIDQDHVKILDEFRSKEKIRTVDIQQPLSP
jgi:hypothetical protein